MEKFYHLHLGKAICAVDLGDGSERGEYVNQDYILSRLGRPHRSISLMYCYYPLDKGFPQRASVAYADDSVNFTWGYPYDDYFPYLGGLNGNTTGEPFTCMRDIRRHGQDVTLTITMDPHLSDDHLRAIGEDLQTFGRVFLRINHEATGCWFSFNKRATYQEVADFYVRAVRIIRETAPNVQHIICIGGVTQPDHTEMEYETEFAQTIPAADIWSIDQYMALHWGFPYDIAEPGGNSHSRGSAQSIYDTAKRSFERFCFLNGGIDKPMVISELNTDGDVTGAFEQAEMLQQFCDLIQQENAAWLTGFTLYQFRDRGRLGLEIQDPNNPDVGIEQPLLAAYKNIIHQDWFQPEMTLGDEAALPVQMCWRHSEDADGIAMPLHFEKNPVFCELYFEDDSNLMIELNGRWFYKSPAARCIDLMPAFYEKPLDGEADLMLKLFAPPASGENDLSAPDGMYQVCTTLTQLPKLRIRFSPTAPAVQPY